MPRAKAHHPPVQLAKGSERPPALPRAGLGAAVAAAAIALAGCGHPASVEECNTLIAKSAELELRAQNVTDPAVIAQRIEAVKAARGEELLKKCVGKRITNRALECVSRAASPKEVDACLE